MSILNRIIRLIRILLDTYACLIGLLYPEKKNYIPPINDLLLLESAVSLSNKIKNGYIKSEDVIKAFINRINSVNPHINALIANRFSAAVNEAIHVDIRVHNELSGNKPLNAISIDSQPFLGIPFIVKDGVSITGMIQTVGSKKRIGIIANDDATFVKRMRNSGAIPIGITNTSEMQLWWDSYNKVYGGTNNPYDKSRIPGGSSGGVASLLSSAGSVIGIGSDVTGSIRIPSNFCGIYGHMTTVGIITMDGCLPSLGQNDQFVSYGPMCRYVSDLRPLLKVLSGDKISMLQLDTYVHIEHMKVYYADDYIHDPLLNKVQCDIREAIEKAVEYLRSKGADVNKVNIELLDHGYYIWLSKMLSNNSIKLSKLYTNNNGVMNPYMELLKHIFGCSDYTFAAIFETIYEKFTPKDRTFKKYIKLGEDLKTKIHQILGDDGVLLYPSNPEPAPKHNGTILKVHNCLYTGIFNLLNVCITQVPMGVNNKGLPIGIQVIGRAYNDHLTISVAEELEKHFGGWIPPSLSPSP